MLDVREMSELREVIEYRATLGAGPVTLRYEGIPLSHLPELERLYVQSLLDSFERAVEVKGIE